MAVQAVAERSLRFELVIYDGHRWDSVGSARTLGLAVGALQVLPGTLAKVYDRDRAATKKSMIVARFVRVGGSWVPSKESI